MSTMDDSVLHEYVRLVNRKTELLEALTGNIEKRIAPILDQFLGVHNSLNEISNVLHQTKDLIDAVTNAVIIIEKRVTLLENRVGNISQEK